MAMSQGERISRLLAPGGRYLSNKQTRDASEQTYMVQARASGRTVNSTPANYNSISGKITDDSTTQARNGKNTCATTVYYNGRSNWSGYTGMLQAAQKCAICSVPDYSANGQIATDLSGGSIKGGYVAPWAPLPNTAKTTIAEQCASCRRFYFPGQPSCCASKPAYTTNYIDTFDDKYGGNRPGKGPTVLSNPLP
jgi:hypothetical protein